MTRFAESLEQGSYIRLAPGVTLSCDPGKRQFVVRYRTTPCAEIELGAGDDRTAQLLAELALLQWTAVSKLGRAENFQQIAKLLGEFIDQDWLQVSRADEMSSMNQAESAVLDGVVKKMANAAIASLELTEAGSFVNALLDLCTPWKARRVKDPPPWSGLTLDLTPFEFSANFDATGVQLRAVAEPQSCRPSISSYWQSAMCVARDLQARWQADPSRLYAVADLFEPVDAGPLAAFFGVGVGRGEPRPVFKVYLSPSGSSLRSKAAVIANACRRLRLDNGWKQVAGSGAEHRWTLACLDLSSEQAARFKIYETLTDSDTSGPDRLAGTDVAELAAELSAALPPTVRGVRWGMLSYTLLTTGEVRYTFGVSVRPGVPQGPVRQCVEALFARLGIDSRPYTTCLRAIAAACEEPVEHSYVTVQVSGGRPRITTYFAPRIYAARFGTFERPVWPSPVPQFTSRQGVQDLT